MSNTPKQSLLVLYSRLPGYFLACLRAFKQQTGLEVHIIREAPDQLAPFQLKEEDGIHFYDRNKFTTQELLSFAKTLSPIAVIVSGWRDKGYKKVAFQQKSQSCLVISGMDNQWIGSFRQRLATFASPFLVKRYFTHIWVPGRFQYEFARRLGFHSKRILMGWYAADIDKFSQFAPADATARRFLYVGRMVPEKGITEFISLAEKFHQAGKNDWRFELIGSGPEARKLPTLSNLRHREFMQPELLAQEVREGGVFILPSRFEPWGVVAQEFAIAGFPLILSSEVGATDKFLREGWNGFSFLAGSSENLYQVASRFCDIPSVELVKMGENSNLLGRSHTPQAWAALLTQTIHTWTSSQNI